MSGNDVKSRDRVGKPAPRRETQRTAYHPRVVLKFRDFVEIPYEDGIEEYLQHNRMADADRLLEQFPGITFRRLYTTVAPEQIQALVVQAAELDRSYIPPNFLTYFSIECPPGIHPEALVEALAEWRIIETAYVESGPASPPSPVTPNDDPRYPNQGYLKKAPNGIDAEYAWGFAGGDGQGVQFIDIERGWMLNHEDLAAANITLVSGVNKDDKDHGTAVLGEVVGVDNTKGGIGIASKASARVVSIWEKATVFNSANAILSAINALKFGDVLLLELQTAGKYPIETEQAVFDAIRLATAIGLVVVEPAGNGYRDLDNYGDLAGKQTLNRNSPDFKDSGAIFVGAASSTYPHTRDKYSNFGSRVDCYAWGDSVDTCWTDSSGTQSTYTSNFEGTSSAGGIIAGAAVVVQGIAADKLKRRFNSWQMRALLGDTSLGTPAELPPPAMVGDPGIGVMPDLKAILTKQLNVAPDVYLRDYVGDKGDPHTGAVSASPDVILVPAKVADPQKSYGEGSGTENNLALGKQVTANKDNYIYVRLRNRGGSPAKDVLATVYWSPLSTLLTPWLWNLAGSVKIANVPAGDILTVSDAITWKAKDIPGPGHYCMVALVGNKQDAAPKMPDFLDWKNFLRIIRENNNVTWRNFNIVPNTPSTPSGFTDLPFLAAGAPEIARRFQLDVVARLPEESEVWLEMPLYLVDAMEVRSPYLKVDAQRNVAGVPINPHGHNLMGEALFPAEAAVELRLLVRIARKHRQNAYELYASQLFEGEEVGRVTWRLVPEESP